MARRRPRLAGWIAWTGLSTLWFALATPPFLDSDRYFSIVFALMAICLAAGIGAAIQGAVWLGNTWVPAHGRYLVLAVGLAFVIATGLRLHQQLTGPARINVVRLRENAAEQAEIGLRIVTTMEPGGVYFTNWTSSWYPRYARHVLGFDRNLRIDTVDFWTMGIDQRAGGSRQRSSPLPAAVDAGVRASLHARQARRRLLRSLAQNLGLEPPVPLIECTASGYPAQIIRRRQARKDPHPMPDTIDQLTVAPIPARHWTELGRNAYTPRRPGRDPHRMARPRPHVRRCRKLCQRQAHRLQRKAAALLTLQPTSARSSSAERLTRCLRSRAAMPWLPAQRCAQR